MLSKNENVKIFYIYIYIFIYIEFSILSVIIKQVIAPLEHVAWSIGFVWNSYLNVTPCVSTYQTDNTVTVWTWGFPTQCICHIFGHIRFVISRNPDDDTYKDIIIYMSLWKKDLWQIQTISWTFFLLQEIMSPWPTTVEFEHVVHIGEKKKNVRNK